MADINFTFPVSVEYRFTLHSYHDPERHSVREEIGKESLLREIGKVVEIGQGYQIITNRYQSAPDDVGDVTVILQATISIL